MRDLTAAKAILEQRQVELTEELDSFNAYEHLGYREFNDYLDLKNPPYWIAGKKFAPGEILQSLDSHLYFDAFVQYTKELDVTGMDSYIAIKEALKAIEKALLEVERASSPSL
mgnify:CR=1 FL=1